MASRALSVAVVAAAALTASAMHAAELLPQHARGGLMYQRLKEQHAAEIVAQGALYDAWAPNYTANWKTSWIDNSAHATGTYQQRFYYDTSFCGSGCYSGSPIVMEVGGEWTVNNSVTGSPVDLASRTGALLVYLEHRFYGESLPYPLSDKAHMQMYLSVEQAIEDIAGFITYAEQVFSVNGKGGRRSWTIVGGSYAGALVTWFTVRHGDMLTATWSSSGVVDAIFNFTAFDRTVQAAVAGSNPACPDALKAVTAAFEQYWDDAAQRPSLLALFNTPTYYTKQDFAWMLADSAAMGPQYGFKDEMCGYLINGTNSYRKGWDALFYFANWTNTHYGEDFGSSCYYSTECLSNSSYVDSWSDSTTWVWQCCSQVAYWQVAYNGSYRSQVITQDYYIGQCQSAYGASTFPDTVSFNARYGGNLPFVGASKVFATQGSDDPWQPAGVEHTINASYLEITAVCDGCSHCKDLHANAPGDSASLLSQREAVLSQLATWIGTSSNPSGLSPGLVGGVVAAAVVVAALGAIIYWRMRRARQPAPAPVYTRLGAPEGAKLVV